MLAMNWTPNKWRPLQCDRWSDKDTFCTEPLVFSPQEYPTDKGLCPRCQGHGRFRSSTPVPLGFQSDAFFFRFLDRGFLISVVRAEVISAVSCCCLPTCNNALHLHLQFTFWIRVVSGPGWLSRYSDSLWADSPGIESRWRARFSAPVQTGPGGPSSLLYNGYRRFLGSKTAGGWRWPPRPSAKVKERVEVFLCSPSGPSRPVLGWSLPFYTSCSFKVNDVCGFTPAPNTFSIICPYSQ